MHRHLVLALPLVALLLGCQSFDEASTGDLTGKLAVASDPSVLSNEPAYLGREHFARAEYALAEANYRAAVERTPSDLASWIGLAASYDQLGRFELADRAYSQASKLSGSTFELLNNWGYSYLLRGNSSRAAALFQQARALRPDDPVLANNVVILRESRT